MIDKNNNLTEAINDLNAKKAWVVFTNQTDLKAVRVLKEGFRHCFILINDGENWISVDPMANYMEVSTHKVPADFDFASWLSQRGHHIIEAQVARNITSCAPIMLFTCVEACKRVLGIHKPFIFTPWQLYQYLFKQQRDCQQISPNYRPEGELAWEA